MQSGLGRTGRVFAYEWEQGVTPDVLTVAKALGGGLPIGATLVGEKASKTLSLGSHGSTFGGNPVAAATARVVWRRVREPALLEHVRRQGEALSGRLHSINRELGMFREIRGKGLMLGAVLVEAWQGRAGALMEQCRRRGVLVLQAGPDVVRFLPPLTISDEELSIGLERLHRALGEARPE